MSPPLEKYICTTHPTSQSREDKKDQYLSKVTKGQIISYQKLNGTTKDPKTQQIKLIKKIERNPKKKVTVKNQQRPRVASRLS